MLIDLQSERDNRNIFISNVGICDYKLPISVKIGNNIYNSICNISSNVALDESSRGAHLSRIVEVLNENLYSRVISLNDFDKIMVATKDRLQTIGVNLEISFDIIMKRFAPVSKKESFVSVNLRVNNTCLKENAEKSLTISLIGTMLCPCSKEISSYGAHNQKCKAMVTLYGDYENAPLLNIIDVMEKSFSANVYSTVKREDEKYITEKAYENPKFSEDLIRDLLIGVGKIYDDKIVAELINYESIHEHNVYARGVINRQLIKKDSHV